MGKRTYTDEQKAFLIDYIPGHTYQETIDEFERLFGRRLTAQIVNGCCNHWGVRTGTLGYFQKGHVPARKFEKSVHASPATEFKPGHSIRCRPVGSERILTDGRTEVKTAQPNVWRLKKQVVWEKHHGEIPPGHVILHKDGDESNFDINNLVCVSRDECLNMMWYGIKWHDPETFETLRVMARIRQEAAKK